MYESVISEELVILGLAGSYLHQRLGFRRELRHLIRDLEELGDWQTVQYGKEVLRQISDKVRG